MNEPPEKLEIPAREAAESFTSYEKRLAKFALTEWPGKLRCPKCEASRFANKGVNGNPSQGNIQRISLICRDYLLKREVEAGETTVGCGVSHRLEPILIHSGLQDAALYLANELKTCQQSSLQKKFGAQSAITAHFKPISKPATAPTALATSANVTGVSTKDHRAPSGPIAAPATVSPELPRAILKRRKSESDTETPPACATTSVAQISTSDLMYQTQLAQVMSVLRELKQEMALLRKENEILRNKMNSRSVSPARREQRATPSPSRGRSNKAPNRSPSPAANRSVTFRDVSQAEDTPFRVAASYAVVAAAAPRPAVSQKRHKSLASKMLRPKTTAPATFGKLYIRVEDSRALKRCRNMQEVNQTIRTSLKSLGINPLVFRFSKIGNSLLELYYADDDEIAITLRLRQHGIQFTYDMPTVRPGVQIQLPPEVLATKTVNRLSRLYARANLVNLKKTILQGHPDDIQQRVLDAVTAAHSNFDPFPLSERGTYVFPVTHNTQRDAESTSIGFIEDTDMEPVVIMQEGAILGAGYDEVGRHPHTPPINQAIKSVLSSAARSL
jgi:hypothetical protein